YATPGTYTVSLTATNSFGPSTTTKANFIIYDPANTFCTNVVMPANGTAPTSNACSASVTDPGGATGNYPNNVNSLFTIAPSNAASVSFTFSSFSIENNFVFLRINDGPASNSPFIEIYSGFNLPNGGTITSTSAA